MSERKCFIEDMKIFLSLANCIKTGILIKKKYIYNVKTEMYYRRHENISFELYKNWHFY